MSTPARRVGGNLLGRFDRFDRVMDEWMRSLPMRRPFGMDWDWPGEDLIRVDQYRDNETEVVRAELPGVDPEKDIKITLSDGILRIGAERRIEDKSEDKGYVRHELRYGSFARSLPLPDGVTESDITATYRDGILEIRIPIPRQAAAAAEPTTIPVTKG